MDLSYEEAESFSYLQEALEPYVTQIIDQNEGNHKDKSFIEKNIPFMTQLQSTYSEAGSSYSRSARSARIQSGQRSDFELRTYNVYSLIHGHSDDICAEFVRNNLKVVLRNYLPQEVPPVFDQDNFDSYHQEVKRSLAKIFFALNDNFRKINPNSNSGCSVSLILQYGWHLICANAGDLKCLIDTSSGIAQLTADHVLEGNSDEYKRVKDGGAKLAKFNQKMDGPADEEEEGVGSLQMWSQDGNEHLGVTRGIGYQNFKQVECFPSICHVELSRIQPTRIILGSGLWSTWPTKDRWGRQKQMQKPLINFSRRKNIEHACQGLIEKSIIHQQKQGLQPQDVSAIVIDCVPNQNMRFKGFVKSQKGHLCMKAKILEDSSLQTSSQSSDNDLSSRTSSDYTINTLKVYKNPVIRIHYFEDGLTLKNKIHTQHTQTENSTYLSSSIPSTSTLKSDAQVHYFNPKYMLPANPALTLFKNPSLSTR